MAVGAHATASAYSGSEAPAVAGSEAPAVGGTKRVWPVLAVLAVGVAVAVNVYVARSAKAPSFPFDEVTLLQFAKFYAGQGDPTPIEGVGYFPGWALILAPVWWFTPDPVTGYVAGIWIGVAMAIATIWPLSLVIRRFGVSLPQAVTAAALIMAMPSRSLQSDYVLSEKMLFLAFVLTALAAFRLWERTTVLRSLVFVFASLVTLVSHARAILIVPVCVIWLLFLVRRNWRVTVVGVLTSAIGGYLLYKYSLAVNTDFIYHGFNQGHNFIGNLSSRPSIFLRVILGESWYQIVSSLGLFTLGLLVMIGLVWGEIRREKTIGPVAWIGGMVLAISIVSVVSWANEGPLYTASWRRLDAWIYGRYVDPFTALVVAAGLAALFKGASRKLVAASGLVSLAVVIPTVYWLAPDAPTWAYMTPAHIPGVMPWAYLLPDGYNNDTWPYGLIPSFTNLNAFWLVASVCTVAFLAIVVLLHRRTPATALILLVAVSVGTVSANRPSDYFQSAEGSVPEIAATVDDIEQIKGSTLDIDFDRHCNPDGANIGVAQNDIPYCVWPNHVDILEHYADLDADLVMSCETFPQEAGVDAVEVPSGAGYGYTMWVLPGALQDELVADGLATR